MNEPAPTELAAYDLVGDLYGALRSWRQLIFPSVFLIYLFQTGSGVIQHTDGVGTVAGMAVLAAFCGCYVLAMAAGRGGRHDVFWRYYATMLVLCAVELPFAHEDAFVMLIYVAVLSVAARYLRSIPVIVAMMAIAAFVPPLVRPWHASLSWDTSLPIGIVSLAMFGFFAVLRSNEALADARSEVARLATENERARIARDLHDLLGHSLTTITVKAGLAKRLALVDPDRAVAEIGEVEELTRRTLADVRAAVSGYRDITLANELAAARELLRAAGITAELPGAVDSIVQPDAELFAWVVREGVTNVVRHSRARTCRVVLGQRYVEITDDGIGGAGIGGPGIGGDGIRDDGIRDDDKCGNGLTGLSERAVEAGAQLTVGPRGTGPGWRLRVEFADTTGSLPTPAPEITG